MGGLFGGSRNRPVGRFFFRRRRFARACHPADFVPLDMAFAAYDHWATFVEQMGSREKRNKTDFRCDLMAALADVLFGAKRIPERAWKTHDLRNRTIRLVQAGFALMRGGYRDLLRQSRRKK
jgi:hypothetical protein